MLGNMEIRTPPGSRPRDGRHCDLCGCSQPAVRCDKCGCQIFCLSCDDMYHRHPKRRFHLRKAVDPIPPNPQARPVLPVKVAHLNTMNPGDPSKMPLPPPRKKKSLFGSFRRPSPSSDNSPPLPKKEYSWTDRLGSIKKFMSNRPLPPLPNGEDQDGVSQPATNGQTSARGDLSFIHKRSEERPPQLPQRSPRPQDFIGANHEKDPRIPNSHAHIPGQVRNGLPQPNTNHVNQNRDFSEEENQWDNRVQNQNMPQAFGTLNRQSRRGFMPSGGPGFPGGMHQSSSATDLHNLNNAEAMSGAPPHPHYPHYPMNPHMPPHYPYPMYPQYPNYPQYFGNSFANISNPPTTDGDFSDQSEISLRHSSKKHPFRKRAKRSQSVMMDKMAYPGQFYPFGPYPGYGPWGAPMPMEAPPSPASSIRSLNKIGRTRRRKKMTSEDDDEEFSLSSSPLSRPKSSSSDRLQKDPQRAPLATQTTSSEDESDGEMRRRRNKVNTIVRRQPEPMRTTPSPVPETKKVPKMKKKSSAKQSDSEPQDSPSQVKSERKPSNSDQPVQLQSPSPSTPSPLWECKHCTFMNPVSSKICQVCCKTATPRTETPVSASSRPPSATESNQKQSVESEMGCSSPEKARENEDTEKKNKQDMAILNSALDEAEKEISRGLEELMKLKDDIDTSISRENDKEASNETKIELKDENTKPVYKSSGRMRTSILEKLNINKPQTSNSSVSTSTEVQTGQNSWTTDKIIEPRRHSNSSTTSETYNSPMAQSPELDKNILANKQKRDSSCQTQQDSIAEYLESKKMAEEAFAGRPVNNFGFGYGDRMDMMTSPVPSMYDRFFGGGFGMMQRSHSRASLFTGRLNDVGPMDYGNPGFGYGGAPMYRSVSRSSLTGDYQDGRLSEFHNLRKPDYYLSMEELVERRRQDNMRAQGLELVRMIREAEQHGFTADDIQVALTHCGKQSPMEWLQDNWRNMVDSVVTLSTNYGNDKKENDIGLMSENEARDALRLHKGNIWAAVTECVEGRQRKYLELSARGKFSRKDIVDALTSSDGDVEMSYAKLSKSTGKPFLMRIWGAGEGAQNQDGVQPVPEDLQDIHYRYQKGEAANSDYLSDDLWSEDGYEVGWEEDEECEEERGDLEDLHTCHEDFHASPQDIRTPESDKSDYCDAFALEDRNMSSPSDDIFFVIPETKQEKKKGFLSKLAALRKDSKEYADMTSNNTIEGFSCEQIFQSKDDAISLSSLSGAEQTKGNGALNAIKNTLSAIKDTVTGSTKIDKKIPCSQPEKRTIIVKGQSEHEPLSSDFRNNVKLASVKQIKENDSLKETIENKINIKEEDPNCTSTEKEKVYQDTVIDNGQLKLEQNKSEIPNIIKSKNKEESKKQSLAERLKFAKQSHSAKATPNSSATQNESPIPDKINKNSSSSKINENISLTQSMISENAKENNQENVLNNHIYTGIVSQKESKKDLSKLKDSNLNSSGNTKESLHYKEQFKQSEGNLSENSFVASSSRLHSENKNYSDVISTPTPVADEILYKDQISSNTKSGIQEKQLNSHASSKSNNKKTKNESVISQHANVSKQPATIEQISIDDNPTNSTRKFHENKTLLLSDFSQDIMDENALAKAGSSDFKSNSELYPINNISNAKSVDKLVENLQTNSNTSSKIVETVNAVGEAKITNVASVYNSMTKINLEINNSHTHSMETSNDSGIANNKLDTEMDKKYQESTDTNKILAAAVTEKSNTVDSPSESQVISLISPDASSRISLTSAKEKNTERREQNASGTENELLNTTPNISENIITKINEFSKAIYPENYPESQSILLKSSEITAGANITINETEGMVNFAKSQNIIKHDNLKQQSEKSSNLQALEPESPEHLVNSIDVQSPNLPTSIPAIECKIDVVDITSLKPQFETSDSAKEQITTESKLFTDNQILIQENAIQNIDKTSKISIVDSDENITDSTGILVSSIASGQENFDESKLNEKLEVSEEFFHDALDVKTSTLDGNETVILDTNKVESSIPSSSEDKKTVKIKSSKTGKLKKSQVQNKDNKELQNQNKGKSILKSESTSSVTSLSTTSDVASENKSEASTSFVDVVTKSEISSPKNFSEPQESKICSSDTDSKEKKSLSEIQNINLATDADMNLSSNGVETVKESEQMDSDLKNAAAELQDNSSESKLDAVLKETESVASGSNSNLIFSTIKSDLKIGEKTESSVASTVKENSTSSIKTIQGSSSGVNFTETVQKENNQDILIPNLATNKEIPLNASISINANASENSLNVKLEDSSNAFSPELPKSTTVAKIETALPTSDLPKIVTDVTAEIGEAKASKSSSELPKLVTDVNIETKEVNETALSAIAPEQSEAHSKDQDVVAHSPVNSKTFDPASTQRSLKNISENTPENEASQTVDSDDSDIQYSDESRPSSVTPPSPIDALRSRFEGLSGGTSVRSPVRPQSPFRRMSFNSRKQVIALERIRDTTTDKPWLQPKIVKEPVKVTLPKRTIKQQLEMERKVRKMVADRKCRTYRKAEIVVQLMDMNFEEEEAIQAANECSTLEMAISYLQQECLLCAGHFAVSQIVSMTHCQHRACRECIRAYFTVQIRDRTILDLLCPFCNEPDIGNEDIAQDYFNHLDIMLKKLVDFEIHELFQRKLRDRVLMKDPNFRWCSQCSSGFIAMPNLKRLVCPDCNAVTCASCRRLWEREHQGISCEAFAAMRDANDPEAQAAGLAKMLTEDGIDCPCCHFKYALAKGGCMHFRCLQCQHDFCSGCSRPFKMGQKCGVSEFCAKLGLHAHHPRNCLFYLRDKEPEDLQKLLEMNDVKFNRETPEGVELKETCQVMEQKETADGMLDDFCGKEVQDGYAGLCRVHYVEYLGQLVNKHKVDPIQIFDNDDLELVLRRANIRLPPKRYRESDASYREKLVNLIQEELPLDKMDGS